MSQSSYKALAVDRYSVDFSALREVSIPKSQPTGRQLLVRNCSIATNPVDVKKLSNFGNVEAKLDSQLIVGYDAAGVVEAAGPEAKLFSVGDAVYFAGDVSKPGTFSEYTLVDERIVGRKPNNLNWDQAATIPLVALTAWEGLFEQMGLQAPHTDAQKAANAHKTLLVIGGAGGVGSFAIQLGKKVLGMKVIATASRDTTVGYCKAKGADIVISHKQDLVEQLRPHGLTGADYIFMTADLDENFDQVTKVANPFAKICFITGARKPVNLYPLMSKRLTLTGEIMFARALTGIEPETQHRILNHVADLLEQRVIEHCLHDRFNFTLQDVRQALQLQQSGTAIGKIAITVRQE